MHPASQGQWKLTRSSISRKTLYTNMATFLGEQAMNIHTGSRLMIPVFYFGYSACR
jgi:hypothetical protein